MKLLLASLLLAATAAAQEQMRIVEELKSKSDALAEEDDLSASPSPRPQ